MRPRAPRAAAAPALASTRASTRASTGASTGASTRASTLASTLALGVALGLVLGLGGPAGCGGPRRAADRTGASPAEPAPGDPRTPIERRRDAACDALGPRLTACAVADARADLAAGKIDQRQFERDTAPAIQRKNTEDFEARCKATRYSSRQVRVLEVCFREETECAPLLDCLAHLRDRAPAGAR